MKFNYNCILAGINTEEVRNVLECIGYQKVGDTTGNFIITNGESGTYSCYTDREYNILRLGGGLDNYILSVKNIEYFLELAKVGSSFQTKVKDRDLREGKYVSVPFGQVQDGSDHVITLYEIKERFKVPHNYLFNQVSIKFDNREKGIVIVHEIRNIFGELDVRPWYNSKDNSGYIVLSREANTIEFSKEEKGIVCDSLKGFLLLALSTNEWTYNQFIKIGDSIVFSMEYNKDGEKLDKETTIKKIREEI